MIRIYCVLSVLFSSCTISQNIHGEYLKQGKDYKYSLVLNKDSTFILSQKYHDANPKCQGRWTYIAKDAILLKCDTVNSIAETLNSGYMQKRKNKIVVVSSKRLRFGNIILKRISN